MRKRKPRRRLSMTSLIDVIFLLLLFFMLSSTFSRFAEVELTAANAGAPQASDAKPQFLRLAPTSLSLNGQEETLETLATALDLLKPDQGALTVIVSLRDNVNAQRLTDLLVTLRGVPGLNVTVLEAS